MSELDLSKFGDIPKLPLVFILTDPKYVTVTDDPTIHFAMDVSTPEEVLEAADCCYHKHLVMPYTETVVKTLLTHCVYGRIFIVLADREDLTAEDSIAKRYKLSKFVLFPVPPGSTDIVNKLLDYTNP